MTASEELLKEIDADLRRAPGQRVVYLEGKTDVEVFFALLGVAMPRGAQSSVGGLYQGVLVRGLDGEGKLGRAPGSGSGAVRQRVELAAQHGREHVYGVLDGDGRTLDVITAEFGAPQRGPLFMWEGYCIENLLAQVTWPAQWGEEPAWSDVLRGYAAYVALNRLHADLRVRLRTLRLHKFQNPRADSPLLASEEVQQALEADRHLIADADVAAMFAAEVEFYLREIGAGEARGHMLLNGKWLLQHLAVARAEMALEPCREVWSEAVRACGGSPRVREWWQRLIET